MTSYKEEGALLTIGELADKLGLQTHILRFWEDKFPVIKPQKKRGNRRFYDQSNVAVVLAIKTMLYEHGLTVRGLQKLIKNKKADAVITLVQRYGVAGNVAGGDTPANTPQNSAAYKQYRQETILLCERIHSVLHI